MDFDIFALVLGAGLLVKLVLVVLVVLIFEPKGLAKVWSNMKTYFRLWPFSY